MELLPRVLVTIVLVGLISVLFRLCNALILKPKRLRSILEKQGIKGPSPTFLIGNLTDMNNSKSTLSKRLPVGENGISHNCGDAILPSLQRWSKEYGRTFMFSLANMQFLHTTDPHVVKELCQCTSLGFGRPSFFWKLFYPLVGDSIGNTNGAVWSQQRKIIAPEFFNNKVKGMTQMIVDSATIVVNLLGAQIEREGGVADINVEYHTNKFSREVIARLCFGSNYFVGEEIFSKLRVLAHITSKIGIINALFPIMRFEILLPNTVEPPYSDALYKNNLHIIIKNYSPNLGQL